MLKKLFATLAILAVPFTASQAENSMPNVLAGLGSTVQVMNEQQLNEVRGTGNLPNEFAFREYYYNYNNYGSTGDFRSYIYDGESTYYGGKDFGASTGSWAGEQWITNNLGVIETRALFIEPNGSGGHSITDGVSGAGWNRTWDNKFRIFSNYDNYYEF